MSGRTFARSRVGEHDLSISRKHMYVGEGYDDTGWWWRLMCVWEREKQYQKEKEWTVYGCISLFYACKNEGIYYETDLSILLKC